MRAGSASGERAATDRAAEVLRRLRGRQEQMTALLERLARSESPSDDREAQEWLLALLAAECPDLGDGSPAALGAWARFHEPAPERPDAQRVDR